MGQFLSKMVQFSALVGVMVSPLVVIGTVLALLVKSPISQRFPGVPRMGRWALFFYLIWAWFIDRHTPVSGGRIHPGLRTGRIWNLIRAYFPCRVVKQSACDLDPKVCS